MSLLRERKPSSNSLNGGQAAAPAPGSGNGYAGYGGYTAQQHQPSQYGGYGNAAAQPAQSHYGGYPQSSPGSGNGGGVGVGVGISSGGYGGYGHSSSLSGDETKNPRGKLRRHGSAASSSLAWQLSVILGITVVALFGATLHYRSRYTHHKRHADHNTALHASKLEEHSTHRQMIEDELDGKVKHVTFLEDRVSELQKELGEVKKQKGYVDDANQRAARREEALKGRLVNMQRRVKKESHREMLDR